MHTNVYMGTSTITSKMTNEPYDKVLRAVFGLRGIESQKHAAYLQYTLLLLEPVIRAKVDFSKKTMELVYSDPNKSTEEILKAIKPVRAMLVDREVVEYLGAVKN